MAIACVSCTCGFADSLIRTRLNKFGYGQAFSVPIIKGKEKTKKFLNTIPQHEDIVLLRNLLEHASKYAVVIGYDDDGAKWVDLSTGKAIFNNVDLEKILEHFT